MQYLSPRQAIPDMVPYELHEHVSILLAITLRPRRTSSLLRVGVMRRFSRVVDVTSNVAFFHLSGCRILDLPG